MWQRRWLACAKPASFCLDACTAVAVVVTLLTPSEDWHGVKSNPRGRPNEACGRSTRNVALVLFTAQHPILYYASLKGKQHYRLIWSNCKCWCSQLLQNLGGHLVMLVDVCFQSRVITDTISQYADPVILVTRKNNPKSWYCVYSQTVNAATKIHVYPFPVI